MSTEQPQGTTTTVTTIQLGISILRYVLSMAALTIGLMAYLGWQFESLPTSDTLVYMLLSIMIMVGIRGGQ